MTRFKNESGTLRFIELLTDTSCADWNMEIFPSQPDENGEPEIRIVETGLFAWRAKKQSLP